MIIIIVPLLVKYPHFTPNTGSYHLPLAVGPVPYDPCHHAPPLVAAAAAGMTGSVEVTFASVAYSVAAAFAYSAACSVVGVVVASASAGGATAFAVVVGSFGHRFESFLE